MSNENSIRHPCREELTDPDRDGRGENASNFLPLAGSRNFVLHDELIDGVPADQMRWHCPVDLKASCFHLGNVNGPIDLFLLVVVGVGVEKRLSLLHCGKDVPHWMEYHLSDGTLEGCVPEHAGPEKLGGLRPG